MTKKFLLIASLCLAMGSTSTLSAHDRKAPSTVQTEDDTDDLLKPIQPTYLKNVSEAANWGSNWYIEVKGGASAFLGKPVGCGDLFDRVKPNFQIGLGKWFTPAVGARLAVQGLKFRNAAFEDMRYQFGTYSFDEQTAGQGSWVIDNTKTSAYSYEDALPMSFNQNGQVELSSCCWNILPVTDGTIVFDIEYQVYQNGKLIADFTGAHSKSCEAEAPGLLAGKRYTYNFLLSRGTDSEITFTTTMEDWKDGDSSDKTLDTQYSDYFFPSDGTENGYEYIDLDIKDADGKSLLFATRNVGAKHPMQAGKYFQWGCVAPCDNDSLDWSDYKYTPTLTGTVTSGYGEGSSVFTKYNTDDDIRVLALEDDAAHQIMGGDWRMPTHEEWALLMAQTHVEKTYMGTVYGLKVTSKTDANKYIFLPAAGMVGSQGLNYINDRVRYWSSTVAMPTSSVLHSLQPPLVIRG